MFRRARRVLTAIGVLACAPYVTAGQQQTASTTSPSTTASSQPAEGDPAKLAGSWTFDDGVSREDHRNWRRPVGNPQLTGGNQPGAGRVAGSGGGLGPPGAGRSGGWGGGDGFTPRPTSSSFDAELRRALRDLLEVAETYEIALDNGEVTVTDDLERALTFSTTGQRQKHRLGATSFNARTSWEGALLKLEIDSVGGFRMTQVFLPTEDGNSMFVSIRVDKPEFTPPIKPITRTYRRTN